MMMVRIYKLKKLVYSFFSFLRLKIDALMAILLIIGIGLFSIYLYYHFFFLAIVKVPNIKDDKIFLNKDNYKFFQDEINKRKNTIDVLKTINYRDVFNF